MVRTPLANDAWQAASLLVGILGNDAGNYAAGRLARCMATRDLAGATTWSLIESHVDLLLTSQAKHQVSEVTRIGIVVE